MKKKLSNIIERLRQDLPYINLINFIDTDISSLEFDSRKVKNGTLFFALPGTHVHGNTFIHSAIENGATAIIYQDEIDDEIIFFAKENNVSLINVLDSRFAMSPASDEFYDSPSKKLIVIGVTGTEGKSSTVSFLWQLLRLMGKKSGFISTVQYSLGDDAIDNPEHQTTPEAPIVQRQLFEMVENGCHYAVVESSSHGLSEKTNRLGNVLFDCGIFMNVTQEHLEFHGTLEQYRSDKANLFRKLDKHNHEKIIGGKEKQINALGIVCLDDINASYFSNETKHDVVGFTMKNNFTELFTNQNFGNNFKGIFYASDIVGTSSGVNYSISPITINDSILTSVQDGDGNLIKHNININLPGNFNVYNTMAAILACGNLIDSTDKVDISFSDSVTKQIITALPKLQSVKGRMTVINQGQDFEVIVDYAHTPSSFRTIFPPLKNRCKGKIISVFGSGGERDTQKRPVQGEIADEFSGVVILTDEDPRFENSMKILEDIAAGVKNKTREKDLFLIPDRPEAIRKAFSLANKNDIVLLLGKSHENSIIYKNHTMKYDEISEAKNALQEKGFTK